jgi:hypothetical protein
MTLCIAAACQHQGEPRIVLCCDWLAGDEYGSAETCDKLGAIAPGWPVLIASTVHKADEIIDWYAAKAIGLKITPDTVLDEVRRIARELKQKLRDERSLLQYGFTVPELIANKSFSRKEIEEIGEFVTFGAEILISTIYDNQAFIFEVRPDGEVIRQPDYGIIGTTAQASAFMQWRCVTSGDELGSVLYEVLEAKRFGEMDGNIGRDTSMYVLEPDGGLHRVKSSYIQTMERRRAKVDKDRLKIQFSPDFLVTKPEDLGFTP